MVTRLTVTVGTRVSKSAKSAYIKRCKSIGQDPSTVLRELIEAFVENRLSVQHSVKEIIK